MTPPAFWGRIYGRPMTEYDAKKLVNEARWSALDVRWEEAVPSMEKVTEVADAVLRTFLELNGPEHDEDWEALIS